MIDGASATFVLNVIIAKKESKQDLMKTRPLNICIFYSNFIFIKTSYRIIMRISEIIQDSSDK